ncbi:sigma-54-dependent Fis family transcriptional regulator [Oceanobacillus sp. J11TS1]|uniref:sigma-54 interaction domain-containing protein n=1 Tax=Oceanobacillus sp. J11TS1 TaxID=2807191 RepID=UPI001B0E025D|nr:sigma 54-interacting transcriptional regulator [Oceanobacillus sp. J11TS1]GIO22546.1 RNA polymerase subunit sigma-54 [Oceanobacillus sp. J11TS1]
MNNGTITEILEESPFLSIILDVNNRIIHCNRLMESILINRNSAGVDIDSIFSIWKHTPESNLIHAEYKNRTFAFIEGELNDKENKILHGIETPEIAMLLKENKNLKMINRELDTIIENSYDGIYITDKNGITLKTNSAIERITNIPKEYYIGKDVNALMKRGILKNSVTNKVLKYQRTVSVVQQNYAGNETILTGSPVFNENGEIEKIITNIRDLSDLNELQAELVKVNELNDKYKKELQRLKNKPYQQNDIITKSEKMQMIYDTARRISNIDATIIILGDTGVGKDELANYIFSNSIRSKEGQFVKLNCGAIPPDLLESELFGYEGGAFTGANSKGKPGMFELADGGILFLDEIGELPLSLQVKLLRVLQEGEIQRVGGMRPKKVDVRIITATNRNLKTMVEKGTFREDLYYRLNVIPIKIPPLRERRDDILPLVQLFLKKVNEKYNLTKALDYKLKSFLLSYNWPGNIRELANLIERLAVTTYKEVITMEDLPAEYRQTNDVTIDKIVSLKDAAEIAEKKVLTLAAEKYKSTYEIAEALGSSQPTIVRKLKKYKINLRG